MGTSVVLVCPPLLHHHSVHQGARKLSGAVTVTPPALNTMIYVGNVFPRLKPPLSHHNVQQDAVKLFNLVFVIQAVMLSPPYVDPVCQKQQPHHHQNAQQNAEKLYKLVYVTNPALPTPVSVEHVLLPLLLQLPPLLAIFLLLQRTAGVPP